MQKVFFQNANIILPTKNIILPPHKKYEIHTFSYKNNTLSGGECEKEYGYCSEGTGLD